MKIRPKYKLDLLMKVEEKIWATYKSYSRVETYIEQFHEIFYGPGPFDESENFIIYFDKNKNINLSKTLACVDFDTLVSMAIDLDIPVPMVLPAFPTFTRKLVNDELGTSLAHENFMKAYKLVYDDPEQAISLANSALETIIKHILSDERFKIRYNKNDTLCKLTETLLKEFEFFPSKDLHKNITKIGSSLLCIVKEIEELRSDKTFVHGKGKTDYIIDDNLYSVYIINSIITVGTFLMSFYNKKYPIEQEDEEIPF